MSNDNGGWEANRKLILAKLDSHEMTLKEIYACLITIKVKLARQEVRTGVIGLLGGAIPVMIALAVLYIKGNL